MALRARFLGIGQIELESFQQEALDLILAAFDDSHLEAALMVMPTGAGKTVVGGHAAVNLHLLHGSRTLILVHRRELASQWYKTLKLICADISVSVVSERSIDWSGDVVIASVPKLSGKLLNALAPSSFDLVIVDEAHHAAASSWQRIMHHFRPTLRLGMSATPIRGNGLCVAKDFSDAIIYLITLRRLVEMGRLADARGWRIRTDTNISQVSITDSHDYDERELSTAVNTGVRNSAAVNAYQKYCNRATSIAFCVNVQHAYAIANLFNDRGIIARAVHGEMPSSDRKTYLEMCHEGRLSILSNVSLVHEGFDAPLVKGVILLRPFTECSARVMLPQSIGRALRPHPAYDHAVIVELIDEDCRRERSDDNLLKAFDIDSNDVKGFSVDGELLSELAARVERNKLRTTRNAIIQDLLAPSIAHHLSPQSLSGDFEQYDVIRQIEEVSGLRYLELGGAFYLGLTRDEQRRPRMVEVRRSNGLWQALLIGTQEIKHLTAGSDLKNVCRAVSWILDQSGATKFMRANSRWRAEPMTREQRKHLARLTHQDVRSIHDRSRGEASDRITMLEAIRSNSSIRGARWQLDD